jgi:ribosomal protein S18 acetylase RimI-like enzyme
VATVTDSGFKVEPIDDLAAWMRCDLPDWAMNFVWYTAARNLHVEPIIAFGQPFERSERYPGMRLLAAKDGDAVVGYLLYEEAHGLFAPHLHIVARDPARRGGRVGDALWEGMLSRVSARPIEAWPETPDGERAMKRWGFTGAGMDWEYK